MHFALWQANQKAEIENLQSVSNMSNALCLQITNDQLAIFNVKKNTNIEIFKKKMPLEL